MNIVNKENTCAIIITYNPGNDIFRVLSKQLVIFKKIIIIDNGSEEEIINELLSFSNRYAQIEIIPLERNFGIAYALNCGIKRALDLKFRWIVSFDQDSTPSALILEYYNKVVQSCKEPCDIGLIGGAFTCIETSLIHDSITWRNSLSLITSATLYNSEIFNRTGLFNEELFIDSVDFEFNLRVRKNRFLTIRIDQPVIVHTLGNPIEKTVLNITVKSTNHIVERRYYMARNHVIISRMYFMSFPLWVLKKNFYFAKSLFQILIVEKDIRPKIKTIIHGLRDGFAFSIKK
jgi:rhamnosyltransferase